MVSNLSEQHRRPATRKQAFFWYLRENGFCYIEAQELKVYWRKYHSPKTGRREFPPFLVEMLEDRRAVKGAHEIEARAKGWGTTKSNTEFGKKIRAIYEKLESRRDVAGVMCPLKEHPFTTRVWVRAKGNRPGYWRKAPRQVNPWSLREYMAGPNLLEGNSR